MSEMTEKKKLTKTKTTDPVLKRLNWQSTVTADRWKCTDGSYLIPRWWYDDNPEWCKRLFRVSCDQTSEHFCFVQRRHLGLRLKWWVYRVLRAGSSKLGHLSSTVWPKWTRDPYADLPGRTDEPK